MNTHEQLLSTPIAILEDYQKIIQMHGIFDNIINIMQKNENIKIDNLFLNKLFNDCLKLEYSLNQKLDNNNIQTPVKIELNNKN